MCQTKQELAVPLGVGAGGAIVTDVLACVEVFQPRSAV